MSDQPTTQSKYQKKKKSDEQPKINPNEVRIKGNQGHVKRYVDYACSLLEGKRIEKPASEDNKEEKTDGAAASDEKTEDADKKEEAEVQKFDTIVLKATGRAINKAVTTAEVVKRQVPGLHQVTELNTLNIEDVWEPLEEGLQEVKTVRRVASITITLSRDEKAISLDAQGYQPPISADAIKPFTSYTRRSNNRGGYRRGGGNNNMRRGGRRRNNNNNSGGRGRRGGGMRGGGGRRGGGGYGGPQMYGGGGGRSPNRSPRGRGRGGRGRGRGRGGYGGNRNRGGGYGGGPYGRY